MPIGAYSVLRLIDPLRDERLNLGVLAWVPQEGFGCTFARLPERVRLLVGPRDEEWVQQKIEWIRDHLRNAHGGREVFDDLTRQFSELFVVTAPCPIKTTSLPAVLSLLSARLLPAVSAPRTRLTDAQLRSTLHDALQSCIAQISDNAEFDELEPVVIGGVRVRPGIRTSVNNHRKLWRAISLRGNSKDERIDRAKSAALDVTKLRGVLDYQQDRHMVLMHVPHGAAEAVADATRWIEDSNATVLPIERSEEITERIDEELLAAA